MNTQLTVDTIRGLAMDIVQKANSGHPGAPMGMADIASVLFLKHLKYNPQDPRWPDRDRFVLSNGHASSLLYSLLHLAGYSVSMDDLKAFRQWDSITPGHPENDLTPGVETTTGPLGQGSGNAVGMALAEAMLAARFGSEIVDHYTYVFAGDGCMMEGITHEVFSLAGHLRLNKLILVYDDNRITIEGKTDLAYSDDVRRRFEGYHWNVLSIDGHNHEEIDQALTAAKKETDRPTIIIARTHIAKGSPNKQDTSGSHGSPLGDAEIAATKKLLGLPEDKFFHVPDEVRSVFAERKQQLSNDYLQWHKRCAEFRNADPALAAQWDAAQEGSIPANLDKILPKFSPDKAMASRQASGAVLQELAKAIPSLVGGSADLAPSTNTELKGFDSVQAGCMTGRNLHFGIREHGMAAIMNGMALHGGFIVYGATFLVFSDYCRPAVRLSALMHLPVIYVFTHDSVFLGEDGPTHQAVEHLAALRAIPNLTVIRPGDAAETSQAWAAALRNRHGPTALILSRQSLPTLDRSVCAPAAGLQQGAYTLWQNRDGAPDLIILATGSEVAPALKAAQSMEKESAAIRVVSFPSWELFDSQPNDLKEKILPAACAKRLVVEAGVSHGWQKYAGSAGAMVCLDRFGASAPAEVLAEKFGFTAEHIAQTARQLLA